MTRWSPASIPPQSGRVALVTGANSGLGLRTSVELARRGARVLLACRNVERGEQAMARLRTEVPEAQAELVRLDLASLASVEACAQQVADRLSTLDLLVDNAGIMAVPRRLTEDGFELQLGTNHLGHFALTGRLLPLLLAAPHGRVVVVSSAAHRMGRLRFDDLMGERSYRRWRAYAQSKLANLLFARELGRRAAGTSLVVAASHPGWASTHLQTGHGSGVQHAAMQVGNTLFAQSDADGALPSLMRRPCRTCGRETTGDRAWPRCAAPRRGSAAHPPRATT